MTSRADRIEQALYVMLHHVDYIGDGKSRACSMTEMVGAVLPKEVIEMAKSALKEPT